MKSVTNLIKQTNVCFLSSQKKINPFFNYLLPLDTLSLLMQTSFHTDMTTSSHIGPLLCCYCLRLLSLDKVSKMMVTIVCESQLVSASISEGEGFTFLQETFSAKRHKVLLEGWSQQQTWSLTTNRLPKISAFWINLPVHFCILNPSNNFVIISVYSLHSVEDM